MITICFTGHRPNKLGGYDWKSEKNQKIMQTLRSKIIELINNSNEKHFYFIFGGALGIDQMAFDVVKKMQDECYDIKTILAIPFENQSSKWFNQVDIDRYNFQKTWADEIIYVDTLENYKIDAVPIGEYHVAKMQLRNKYMVDNSNKVIAVWNGTKGGTANCVKYAQSKGKEIIRINPDKL